MTETAVETTEVTVEQLVAEQFVDPQYSPYGIARDVNKVLASAGLKAIPAQMMYNYARNGLIVKGAKGRKVYSTDEVREWATKYITRRLDK